VFKQNAEEYVKAKNDKIELAENKGKLIAQGDELWEIYEVGPIGLKWYKLYNPDGAAVANFQDLELAIGMARKYYGKCRSVDQIPSSAGIEQTLKEREETHGDFSSNAEIAQIIKNVFRGNAKDGWTNMPSEVREGLDMIASKLCRILSGGYNYIDNWHDIQGYAALVEKYLDKANQPYDDYPPPVTGEELIARLSK